MARRKKKSRKASAPKSGPAAQRPPVARTVEPPSKPPPELPVLDDREFRAAIAAELQAQAAPGQGSTDGGQPVSPPAPGADFEPAALTMEGLTNAWRVPFYVLARVLAWLRVAPDPEPIETVGRRRAKELAKASYPVWDHYARQYLNVHPDQAVNVSIGVTILDSVGIVPDLIDAIGESRRRAARFAASVTPPPAAVETAGRRP